MVEVVAVSVTRRVDPLVNLMEHVAKIQKVTDVTKEELQRMVEEMKEELQMVMREVGGIATGGAGHWESGGCDGRSAGMEPMLYAAMTMLNSGLPTTHVNTLARMHTRKNQFLVDRDPQVSSNHLGDLNEQELAAKANEVL